jgi:UDP-N-acetylglucosamine 2-epimerase (non-hydrolysing)
MAPVYLELRKSRHLEALFCSTGQHNQMLKSVLQVFDIVPQFDLEVMTPDQSLHELTCRLLLALHKVYSDANPDIVMVQGDTTTTMVGALCAHYRKVKVAHLEAGLRSFDKLAPFPEEVNRTLTTHIADYHFAPTRQALLNLRREGVKDDHVFLVGNTVIDALLHVAEMVKTAVPSDLDPQLQSINWSKNIILVTGHRRESFGEPLARICRALRRVAEEDDVQVVYPVHLNPNVRAAVFSVLGDSKNVQLLEPLPYPAMVFLMGRARIILTDSGGIQEEAPALRKPVLVMREITERPEGVEAGVALIVGTSEERIVVETLRLLRDPDAYAAMASGNNPYGDGRSSERIRDIFEQLAKPASDRDASTSVGRGGGAVL